MAPGQPVVYVDSEGVSHHALVIHVFETCINVVYVEKTKRGEDSLGNARHIVTSVPFFEPGMSGNYIAPKDMAYGIDHGSTGVIMDGLAKEPDNTELEEVIENETEIEDLEDGDQGEAQDVENPELTASTGLTHTIEGDAQELKETDDQS
jgi:hypothetical protein